MKKYQYKSVPELYIHFWDGFIYGYFMWPILKELNFRNYYFFLPFFFVIFLLSYPLSFFIDFYSSFYFLILAIYFVAIFLETIRICNKIQNFLKIMLLLIFANIVPGFGILFGLFNFLEPKK